MTLNRVPRNWLSSINVISGCLWEWLWRGLGSEKVKLEVARGGWDVRFTVKGVSDGIPRKLQVYSWEGESLKQMPIALGLLTLR